MDVYSDALKIILAKRRTKKEVYEALLKKGYEEHDAQNAVEYYEEREYLDDADYARRYTHDAAYIGGKGKNRIEHELLEKGICEEYIFKALSGIEFNVKEKMQKKFGEGEIDYKSFEKIKNHFLRKGFTYSEINEAASELYTVKREFEC